MLWDDAIKSGRGVLPCAKAIAAPERPYAIGRFPKLEFFVFKKLVSRDGKNHIFGGIVGQIEDADITVHREVIERLFAEESGARFYGIFDVERIVDANFGGGNRPRSFGVMADELLAGNFGKSVDISHGN